jgi:hypothetical protein
MEKIESFVARTRGPMIPFVAEWYPWAYAHHYLRIEMERVPMDLDRPARSLSLDNAMGLVHRWCAVTGEEAEQAARRLADAYLERWGLQPPEAAERRRTRQASRDERWHGRSTGSDERWRPPLLETDDEAPAGRPAPHADPRDVDPRAHKPAELPRAHKPAELPRAHKPPELPRAHKPPEQPRAHKPPEQPRAQPQPEPLRALPYPEPLRALPHPQPVSAPLALLPASGAVVLRGTLAGEPTLILPVVSGEIQELDPPEQPARIQLTTGH